MPACDLGFRRKGGRDTAGRLARMPNRINNTRSIPQPRYRPGTMAASSPAVPLPLAAGQNRQHHLHLSPAPSAIIKIPPTHSNQVTHHREAQPLPLAPVSIKKTHSPPLKSTQNNSIFQTANVLTPRSQGSTQAITHDSGTLHVPNIFLSSGS